MKKLVFGATATIAALTTAAAALATDYSYSTNSNDGAFAGISLIFWCCCIAAAMLIPIALSIYIYKDAEKSGVENPILWALIAFCFGIIGILLYFLVGKNNTGAKK